MNVGEWELVEKCVGREYPTDIKGFGGVHSESIGSISPFVYPRGVNGILCDVVGVGGNNVVQEGH